MDERLQKQLNFILEIDKEKNIFRQTHLSGHGRRENDAEHAWHMAVMAYLLQEYSNEPVDVARVMLMCLLHDVVEIDAGDTYAYDADGLKTQKAREDAAKQRIYSLLPDDQKRGLMAVFDEFEADETAEAHFAHAMDNLQPLLLNNSNGGSDGIISNDIDLSGSLELTAKAGSPNGKALSQNGHELDLDTIKDKLGPGAKVTATDANGETKQVSVPRPVEPEGPVIPEESSSSSDGGSAAPSAPASPLPGLTVTDKDGQRISYTSTQSGNTLTVCVGRLTASFRISLAALRQLRAEGIEAITFQTILCSTTLSLDELLTMGGEDAEAVLTHRFTDSSLTVG